MTKHPESSSFYSNKTFESLDFYIFNDIAIIELEEPFEFGNATNVFPACLLDQDLWNFKGPLYAAGYGGQEVEMVSADFGLDKNSSLKASAEQWLSNSDFDGLSSKATKKSLMMANLDQYKGAKCKHNMICAVHPHHSTCSG